MERECSKERWEDDEEEALSLSDLPMKLIKEEEDAVFKSCTQTESANDIEFSFGSIKNSTMNPLPQMCSADDLFFQGRILPARLSLSSENSSVILHRHHSRGESAKFKSISISSSNNNSMGRVQNIFRYSHPSPKPQIEGNRSGCGRSQRWSMWDILRVGMVKTPGMELEDLRYRSRRWNFGSRSSSGGSFGVNEREKEGKRERIWMDGIVSGIGCKCTVEIVPPVTINDGERSIWMREKMKKKKKLQNEKEQQEKLELSRHRTFEWLKELSHASFPCEEA